MFPVFGKNFSLLFSPKALFTGAFLTGTFLIAPLLAAPVAAQGFFGGDETPLPHITLAQAEIVMDVPMHGNDLEALLAQAAAGKSLSAAKEKTEAHFIAQLRTELETRLREFLTDEEVPLITDNQSLTLHSAVDLTIAKELNDIRSSGDYELERGRLTASGDYHLRLKSPSGRVLREKRVDIADLRLRQGYQIKTPNDGRPSEDNTNEQLQTLMAELAERLLDRIEDDLEADSLRELNRS